MHSDILEKCVFLTERRLLIDADGIVTCVKNYLKYFPLTEKSGVKMLKQQGGVEKVKKK
jgi:hypothetical protein